jgi:hypothetical protein
MTTCINWLAQISVTLAATLMPFFAAAAEPQRSLKAEVLFRLAHPCPATGQSQGECAGYVIDRIIPLICGGTEEPANMQWQTIAEAKEKDKWERIGCRPGRKLFVPQAAMPTEVYPLSEAPALIEATPLSAEEATPQPVDKVKPLPAESEEGK